MIIDKYIYLRAAALFIKLHGVFGCIWIAQTLTKLEFNI